MKKAMSLLLVIVTSASLAGCIVQRGPRQSSRASYARSCPPAHHWEGGACVHNGRARGHNR